MGLTEVSVVRKFVTGTMATSPSTRVGEDDGAGESVGEPDGAADAPASAVASGDEDAEASIDDDGTSATPDEGAVEPDDPPEPLARTPTPRTTAAPARTATSAAGISQGGLGGAAFIGWAPSRGRVRRGP